MKLNNKIIDNAFNNELDFIKEAKRCLNCLNPKCVEGCPINNKIPQFINLGKNKDYDKAYKIILENSILPDICSIVCPHEKQCEGHCVRSCKGESIKIGAIERYISEHAKNKRMSKTTKNKFKVATIGSGPASLSFALYLSRLGYGVDVYEKENFIGGVLTWGIPSFRLDRNYLSNYIDELKNNGVNFYLNYKFDDSSINLIKNYDGIFIGVGTSTPNKMNISNENTNGVFSALEFLRKINLSSDQRFDECGKNVVVVGGGNVAMDASRCAIRLPQVKSVKIIYRRSEVEMPACHEELSLAKKEGIEFMCLTNPISFVSENDKLKQIECANMELGELDSSGRRRPVESNKPHFYLDADTCICALGFNASNEILKIFPDLNVDKNGHVIIDENNMTSIDNVYAGGDCVTGAKTVVLAMKAGINAAKKLDQKLNK